MSAQVTKQGVRNLDLIHGKQANGHKRDLSILDACPHTETFTRIVNGDELVFCVECKEHLWG